MALVLPGAAAGVWPGKDTSRRHESLWSMAHLRAGGRAGAGRAGAGRAWGGCGAGVDWLLIESAKVGGVAGGVCRRGGAAQN